MDQIILSLICFPVTISGASSETTDNIVMKRVRGYQRYLCNKLKTELFDPLLIQGGFDPDAEDTKIGFTSQNIIGLEVQNVKDLASQGLMSKNEAREWLRVNTGMELPDDDIIAQEDEERKELDKQQIFNKSKEIKKEAMKGKKVCTACKENQHAFCSKRGCQCQ